MRSLPIIAAVAAAACAAALVPAPDAEAKRKVPRGFYGLTYDGEIRSASPEVQAGTWGRMAANGAEAARTVFSWAEAQPERGAPFDFSASDRVVEDAAHRRVQLLPVVMRTPAWARAQQGDWWPERASDYAGYVRELVRRYGRGGTFWAENPSVPRRPVRHWQILNEPAKSKEYGRLLRAAKRAIRRTDRGAKVVLAGLTGTEDGTPWDILRWQYRRGGIKGHFDIAAIHMYTGKPANVVEGVRRFRRVMRRQGDGRRPLWLTEFGITASRGRTDAPSSQNSLRTTDRGMARFLTRAYRGLVRNRRDARTRVARAYWYTWASSYQSGGGIFRFAGLLSYADGRFEAKPALAAYRKSARRDQGCRKTTAGRCR